MSATESLDVLFARCRPILTSIAWRFARRYRRDREEVYADACLHFLEAVNGYDPDKNTNPDGLERRVQFVVWRRLLSMVRRDARRAAAAVRRPNPDISYLDVMPFDEGDWSYGLSDDAREAVRLLLHSPEPLDAAFRAGENLTRTGSRRCFVGYLREQLGWAKDRVTETIHEIRSALRG